MKERHPKEYLEKIGIPFFTTKENGTGLGITTCYRIAEKHKAKISIESDTHGTKFFVRFPAPISFYLKYNEIYFIYLLKHKIDQLGFLNHERKPTILEWNQYAVQ